MVAIVIILDGYSEYGSHELKKRDFFENDLKFTTSVYLKKMLE